MLGFDGFYKACLHAASGLDREQFAADAAATEGSVAVIACNTSSVYRQGDAYASSLHWHKHSVCVQIIAQREVAALLGINAGNSRHKAKERRQQNIIVQVLCSCLILSHATPA